MRLRHNLGWAVLAKGRQLIHRYDKAEGKEFWRKGASNALTLSSQFIRSFIYYYESRTATDALLNSHCIEWCAEEDTCYLQW